MLCISLGTKQKISKGMKNTTVYVHANVQGLVSAEDNALRQMIIFSLK